MTSAKNNASEVQQVLDQDRPRRRAIIMVLLIVSALIVIGLMFSGNDKKPAMQFISAAVERGDLIVQVTATGNLEPVNQVEVGSEISGTIDMVLVDFNDRISKGQVLTRLNTDEQQAKVLQASAALEVAESRVLQAKATMLEMDLKLKRCQTLSKKGLCPPQELDAAEAAFARAEADQASARAQVSQAKANLDVEQTRLAKAVIRSPIDGIVLNRQIEPGQTVAASLQAPVLFILAENLAQMELRVAVDEADIGKVREGQLATFTVDAYGEQVFPAEIIQVRLAPLNEGGVVSYETVLSLNNEELLLRPGMTATAHITVEEISDALLIPNAALRFMPPPVQNKDKTGFMDQLMPRWGARSRSSRQDTGKLKRVWLLQGGQPVSMEIATGPSDGRVTQVFSEELLPGMAVIVDAMSKTR